MVVSAAGTVVAGIGPAGLWLGLVSGLTVAAALLMRRFWRGLARGDWTREAQPV